MLQLRDKLIEALKYLGIIVLLLFTGYYLIERLTVYNMDNYFMFSHARYFLKHGFTSIDPIRMHEGLNFVYPQWLFATILYLVKTTLGDSAIIWLMLPVNLLILLLLYNIGKTITQNAKNIFLFSFFNFTLFASLYSGIRPYIVSAALCLTTIYLMEKGMKAEGKRKKMYFSLIPFVSILQVNFHNTLWLGIFLVLLCYIGEGVYHFFFTKEPYPYKEILLITAVSLLCGLINPYGIKYITYAFTSVEAVKPAKVFVGELKMLTPSNSMALFLVIVWENLYVFYLVFMRKIRIPIRYLLLFYGFMVFSVMSTRNGMYFLSAGQVLFVWSAQFAEPIFKTNHVLKRIFLAGSIVTIALLGCMRISDKTVRNEYIDCVFQAVDWIDETAPAHEVSVFASNDIGSYLGYRGFRPYIDAMIELYGIENNKQKDILGEYIYEASKASPAEFSDFLDSYGFRYVFAENEKMIAGAEQNENYVLIYGRDNFRVYERKTENQ